MLKRKGRVFKAMYKIMQALRLSGRLIILNYIAHRSLIIDE